MTEIIIPTSDDANSNKQETGWINFESMYYRVSYRKNRVENPKEGLQTTDRNHLSNFMV